MPGQSISRLTICDPCGSPVEVSAGARNAACPRCGSKNEIAPLDDSPLSGRAHRPEIDETERLKRLRLQDGKPLQPPDEITDLLHDGDLAEWKVDEALELWLGTRRQLQQAADPAAEKRLMFLNLLLANYFGTKDKQLTRALRDAALDVVTLKRYRQELRCDLARAAARAGRFSEADAWLEPCDPCPEDLGMDSTYRYAKAFCASLRGEYDSVLKHLGEGMDDVPIADQYDGVCAVVRADAHEKRGDIERAVGLLREAMSRGMGHLIRLIVEKHSDEFHWCELSFERAQSEQDAAAAKRAAGLSGGGMGGFLLIMGLLEVATAIGLAIGGLAGNPSLFLPSGILAVVGGGITLWGWRQVKQQKQTARIRQHGLRAKGTVVSVSRTGLTVNDIPQMKIVLQVELEGRGPYEASTKLLVAPQDQATFQPGSRLRLRVDPQDPEQIVLETN